MGASLGIRKYDPKSAPSNEGSRLPDLIQFLGPSESTAQTASPSGQPFLFLLCQIDMHCRDKSDRPRKVSNNNGWHLMLCIAMWPNNKPALPNFCSLWNFIKQLNQKKLLKGKTYNDHSLKPACKL